MLAKAEAARQAFTATFVATLQAELDLFSNTRLAEVAGGVALSEEAHASLLLHLQVREPVF